MEEDWQETGRKIDQKEGRKRKMINDEEDDVEDDSNRKVKKFIKMTQKKFENVTRQPSNLHLVARTSSNPEESEKI